MNETLDKERSASTGETVREDAHGLVLHAVPQTGDYLDQTLTVGGRIFTYGGGDAAQIDIVDIATALGNMCRFAGHVRRFYSVAEHSVLVSLLVPPSFALQGLLHDAHEAYATDVPTPLKQRLPDYQKIEKQIAHRVRTKLGVPLELDSRVKDADWVALHLERDQLLPPHSEWVTPSDMILPDRQLACYPPHVAKNIFLQRYYDLVNTFEGSFK